MRRFWMWLHNHNINFSSLSLSFFRWGFFSMFHRVFQKCAPNESYFKVFAVCMDGKHANDVHAKRNIPKCCMSSWLSISWHVHFYIYPHIFIKAKCTQWQSSLTILTVSFTLIFLAFSLIFWLFLAVLFRQIRSFHTVLVTHFIPSYSLISFGTKRSISYRRKRSISYRRLNFHSLDLFCRCIFLDSI